MSGRTIVLAFMVLCLAARVEAQWLNYPTPGLPRTASGAVNLDAPAPRTADGKPDLSGVWTMDAGSSVFYLPGPLQPTEIKAWASDLVLKRGENFGLDDQGVRCLPEGPRFTHFPPILKKIVQTPALIVILGEDLTYRQIFLDGRPLPKDPSPSFMGYSVGRWDGDTLVVETVGYKDSTWLDFAGHPHSERLKVVERFRRVNLGRIEIDETFDDPEVFARPVPARVRATLVPDTDLLEYVCNENEKDRPRMVGTASAEMKQYTFVKVAPQVLARYAGDYDFRWPEVPAVPSIWPVTLAGDQLLLQGAPLMPISETEFVWAAGNRLRFVSDGRGRVTHFVITLVEGDLQANRVVAPAK